MMKPNNLTPPAASLLAAVVAKYPGATRMSRLALVTLAEELGLPRRKACLPLMSAKASRGVYDISQFLSQDSAVAPTQPVAPAPQIMKCSAALTSITNTDTFVPSKDPTYVSWGDSDTVARIVSKRTFCPVFISGLSGNGKTMMVEQVCADHGREYIRLQISQETDENDILGGYSLVDGNTVFAKGPAIKAMERGAILLIDEIDRASSKIMCLQGILEGKEILIKKTGEVVRPAAGFNVIATANTKGKGSEDGRFVTAGILDEAFLERFVATIEQPYPPKRIEHKIILRHMKKFGLIDEDFADRLTTWSEVIRKTFEADGVDEVISTRRLCHIAQTFSIFTDRMRAIELCISRFDDDTKLAFTDLYTKIDPSVVSQPKSKVAVPLVQQEPPF